MANTADIKLGLIPVHTSATDTSVNTANPPPAYSSFTQYNIYYSATRLDVTLHAGPSSSPCAYYVESKLGLRSCRMLLRRGDKKGPIVAFARTNGLSRHLTIGLGDCEDKEAAGACSFEQLARDKNNLRCSDWRFETETPGGSRTELAWRKDKTKMAASVFDCVDEDDTVLGRMASGGAFNWKKGGEVEVNEGLDQGVRELVIASALGIWCMEALNYRSLARGYDKKDEKKKHN